MSPSCSETSNVFRIGLDIELKKLSIHDSLIESVIEPRSNG